MPQHQLTPVKPDPDHIAGDELVRAREVCTTFGLHPTWGRTVALALQHDVDPGLNLLCNAVRMNAMPDWAGTAFAEITSEVGLASLELWSDFPTAQALHDLARVIASEPGCEVLWRPLTKGKSGGTQFRGRLREFFVCALLVEHIASPEPDVKIWLHVLRIWLLVLASDFSKIGNVEDAYLREAFNSVRQACERTGGNWLPVVRQLAIRTAPWHEFNTNLSFRAQHILRLDAGELRSQERRFLNTIYQLAQGKASPTTLTSSLTALWSRGVEDVFRSEVFDFSVLADEELRYDEHTVAGDGLADIDGVVHAVTVNPAQPLFQQRELSRSIFLLSAEDLHYLPWAWGVPNPAELLALQVWMDKLLGNPDQEIRLLGAALWLSAATGRSFRQLDRIVIGEVVSAEWSVSPSFNHLLRLPPRRQGGWIPKTKYENAWVREAVESNLLPLPSQVSLTLREAAMVRTADVLGGLWCGEPTLRQRFRTLLPSELDRLTPGMVAKVLMQRIYLANSDALCARMITSNPLSGLPGGCAYANWTGSQLETVSGIRSEPPEPARHDLIALGSRLDPLDALLTQSIARATAALRNRLERADSVTQHNARVAYLVTALLSATGGRPCHDPFESWQHIDLDQQFVYIEDKSSGESRAGRLVPIPPTLTRALDDYRRYLFTLASHLSDTNALLAGAITSISLPNEASTVPLFFFLERKNCGLGWGSVSAQSLKATGLFDWPLPPNLFRQRLSKRLRQRGLDGEIIDALMGHSEQNCMTYADDSTRVWSADMAVARDHLAACFNSLGFKFSNVWRIGETCWPPGPSTQSARAFGIRARALERQATIDRAHEQAESIIAEFCQGRAIIDFSEDELYELSKKLMLSPNGTPITTGYERYSILERMLAKAWEEQGQRVRLSRRFFRVRPSPSPHTVACVGAMRWLNGARSLLTKIDSDVVDRSIHVKRLHAAILLCIEARIADPDLLAAVRQGTTYRIMHYERQCYLEYGATAGDGPDALVRRFPISHSLGNQLSALTAADRSSATLLSDRRIPQRYAVLIRTHRHTVGDRSHSPLNEQAFWRALGQQMDAVNVMDLPGCLAASYAGRCRPVSLTWRDTIRLRTGKVADFTTISSLDDKSTLASVAEDANLNWITPLPGISPDETELQPRARQFLKQLTGLLPTQSDSLKTSATPSRRRDLGLQIRKLVRDFNGRISPTVLMLGQWVESLVIRGSRTSKPLAMSTISRYAVTLKRAFLELAYAIDIRSLDDEALTDFYAAVLSSNDFDRPDYVAARLAQFHYWASPLGVAEPDWGAMPVTVVAPSRSPGWIGESDYIRALVCLQGDRAEPDLTLIRAFVLLASYRFGLRSSESLGLSRRDWVEQGSVTVVLVRNMPWRSLKSPASRRQVPLLFLLTKQECDLINQVMARAQALWGDDMDTCLLGRSAEVRLPPEVGWIRPHIIGILKHVTGNPHINLHHTRHSAANRATSAVLQLKERFTGTAYPAQPTPQIADDIGTILLGHGGPSRRQSWALGRYLGHAGTQTIWNSYLHIHDVWAVECGIGKTATIEPQSLLDNVINLDAVPLSHPVDTQLLAYQAAVPRALTPMLAVGCLRLLANTTDASVCAEALNLAAADGQRIGDIATQIGHRLVLSKSKSNTKRVATDDYDFLRRITPSGWTRLLQTSSSMVPGLLRANQSTDSANAQARVCELVGASGQLLMWESWHGDFIRGFLNAAGIEETQYRVLRTKRWEPALDAMLAAWKFEARADDDRIRRVQIDPALAVSAALSATRRAALVWRECSTGAIRNRLEMLVLLAAYGACQR